MFAHKNFREGGNKIMFLHEAIIRTLETKKGPLSIQEIADELNRTKLYEKKDKSLIQPSQISLRVRKPEYKAMFVYNKGMISLRKK